VPPRRWSDEILYFVVVDRFADGDTANNAAADAAAQGAFHGGDLKGLREQLEELSSLGVTALWITPVVKNIDGFVTGAGFPDWGYHGYWADDFHQLDPRFGTEEDLRALVDEAHRRGIRVLLDVVYNHPGYNSRYVTKKDTKDWLRSEERGTCGQDDLTSCVSGLPDFKTELPEVAKYLLDAQLDWAKRSGVDGFRLDTVKHVDHPFWKEHRRRTREEVDKDFFLLGEVWGGDAESLDPWFAGDEMDAGFDFGFQGSSLAFVQGRGRVIAFDRYLKSRGKVRPGYLLAHFLSSHDVPGALYQLEGDVKRFRLAAVLQLTSSGLPTLYYGEEVARPGGDWPANRSDMPWGSRGVKPGAGKPRDEELRKLYQKLISIRRAHPALPRGTHQGLSTDGDLYVYLRHDAESGDAVMVAINRAEQPAKVSLPWPAAWGGTVAEDLLNGGRLEGPTLELTVEPLSARILGRTQPQ
jgi:alpha-amylase